MNKAWLFIPFLLIWPAQADIYRWVDEQGNVVFSDEPDPRAEKIELPASMTYTPEPAVEEGLSEETAEAEPAADVPDYQLRIIAPADDESLWANDGNVTVSVIIEPALDTERGDKLLFVLDGNFVGEPLMQTSVQLLNLDRGTHSVSAAVVDSDGTVITDSAPVTFHLHRTSVLNRPGSSQN